MDQKAQSDNGRLEALKAHFRPYKIEIVLESGATVILWTLPMKYDFYGGRRRQEEIESKLKGQGLEGGDFDAALNYELICDFLIEHLVQPPKDPQAGFGADEVPSPLFTSAAEISTNLPYTAIFVSHREIQQRAFASSKIGEAALKNL
jgi:hypothetical protein